MERKIQHLLQRLLGFRRYLYVFSRFKAATLRFDHNEGDVLTFVALMPRDAVVLDIGANIGIMTVHLARRVDRGQVHAFEPVADNLVVLRKVVEHGGFSNVTVHPVALGAEEGTVEMVMPLEDSVRMQGLSRVVTGGPSDPSSGEHYEVPQRRLDDIEELESLDVAGIKIDVEDFEQYVFAGGRSLIERCRPIIYTELGLGENRGACLSFFESVGYSLGVLVGGRVVEWDPSTHDKHNFFVCPNERLPWTRIRVEGSR